MQRKSRIRTISSAVAIGLTFLIGVHMASAALLFDRGLPTANLNHSANPNRSNIALYWGPDANPNPPSYQVYGDDFMISGSGTYHIDTARIWIVLGSTVPTNLKLWAGQEDSPLELVSSSFTATKVYYAGGQNYERLANPGYFVDFYQIDFVVNRDVEGGQKYQFFVDTPIFSRYTNGVLEGYTASYLHESNAALSGSTQEGADNYVLRLTLNAGVPGAIEMVDASNLDFGRSVDANIQLYGNQVPLPSTLYLIGSGLLGLLGYRRLKKS
jgi:hypothetical protein